MKLIYNAVKKLKIFPQHSQEYVTHAKKKSNEFIA